MVGKIKRLIVEKGIGFIRDSGGTDYFFHHSHVLAPDDFYQMSEGEQVEFEISPPSPKGERCEMVRRIG